MRGLPADGTLRKLSLSQRRGGPVLKPLVVMAVDSMLRGANRAQAGIQRLHDQALVGAERSRVGIRLGLRAFSKPDDDTGTSRGENAFPDAQDFSKYFGACFWYVLLFVLLLGSEPRPFVTE